MRIEKYLFSYWLMGIITCGFLWAEKENLPDHESTVVNTEATGAASVDTNLEEAPNFEISEAPAWKPIKASSYSTGKRSVGQETYKGYVREIADLYACRAMGYYDKVDSELLPFAFRNALTKIAGVAHKRLQGNKGSNQYMYNIHSALHDVFKRYGFSSSRRHWYNSEFQKLESFLYDKKGGALISSIAVTAGSVPFLGVDTYKARNSHLRKLIAGAESVDTKKFFSERKDKELKAGKANKDYCVELLTSRLEIAGVQAELKKSPVAPAVEELQKAEVQEPVAPAQNEISDHEAEETSTGVAPSSVASPREPALQDLENLEWESIKVPHSTLVRSQTDYKKFTRALVDLYACQAMGFYKDEEELVSFAYWHSLNEIAKTSHSKLPGNTRRKKVYKYLVWNQMGELFSRLGYRRSAAWSETEFKKLEKLLTDDAGLVSKVAGTMNDRVVSGLAKENFDASWSPLQKLSESAESASTQKFFGAHQAKVLKPGQSNEEYCFDLIKKNLELAGVPYDKELSAVEGAVEAPPEAPADEESQPTEEEMKEALTEEPVGEPVEPKESSPEPQTDLPMEPSEPLKKDTKALHQEEQEKYTAVGGAPLVKGRNTSPLPNFPDITDRSPEPPTEAEANGFVGMSDVEQAEQEGHQTEPPVPEEQAPAPELEEDDGEFRLFAFDEARYKSDRDKEDKFKEYIFRSSRILGCSDKFDVTQALFQLGAEMYRANILGEALSPTGIEKRAFMSLSATCARMGAGDIETKEKCMDYLWDDYMGLMRSMSSAHTDVDENNIYPNEMGFELDDEDIQRMFTEAYSNENSYQRQTAARLLAQVARTQKELGLTPLCELEHEKVVALNPPKNKSGFDSRYTTDFVDKNKDGSIRDELFAYFDTPRNLEDFKAIFPGLEKIVAKGAIENETLLKALKAYHYTTRDGLKDIPLPRAVKIKYDQTAHRKMYGTHMSKVSIDPERAHIMTIVDYNPGSYNKRLSIVDLKKGELLMFTQTAHGSGSGRSKLVKAFGNNWSALKKVSREHSKSKTALISNVSSSHSSSVGRGITALEYDGDNGVSLRIFGLDGAEGDSWNEQVQDRDANDKMYDRDIVFHGAWYVNDGGKSCGMSHGCPAVSTARIRELIRLVEDRGDGNGGTFTFFNHDIYQPEYLKEYE